MEADAILMAVECALKPLGLQRATILSGHDEGLFAWLSTNYLFEVIPQKSVRYLPTSHQRATDYLVVCRKIL